MTAVVDSAAALGLFMHCAEKLPFGGPHFRARYGAAGRRIKQEAHNEAVALGDEEPTEFI
jgi:hypothetical protein